MPTTYPHDYRALFAGADEERPTIVGGQAVNLWAITYLDRADPASGTSKYGSHDLDVISTGRALAFLKKLPNWRFDPTPMKHFGVGITARLQTVTNDGRLLLVEVLHSVAGLDASDLRRVSELTASDGTVYRLLDPIAMVKAKAYNARKFKQDDNPPRHDREHLELIAKCLPEYLREIHATAVRLKTANPAAAQDAIKEAADAVSAAFVTLTHHETAATLRAQGVPPESLIPPEFKESPIEKVANAWKHQHPRLAAAGTRAKG
ncbi:hypothetical protein DB347_25200 [Opitutaceae bacterium EW11]|nr:hypothetical protein DB347_25200 [Opitutaceae bacterium EW11]